MSVKWKTPNRILTGFILYAVCCILCIAAVYTFQGNATAQTTVYGNGNEENQGVLIGNDTVAELRFQSQTDRIESFCLHYYDNGKQHDGQKLCFVLYDEGKEEPLATQEIELAVQSDDTPIFVRCPVENVQGKSMRLRIYGLGIEGKEGPILGYALENNAACTLEVDGEQQDGVLNFMVYSPGKKDILPAAAKLLCLLAGGALVCFLISRGETESRKSEKKKKEKTAGKRISVKTVVVYGMILLFLCGILEFTYSKTVDKAAKKQEELVLVEEESAGKYFELSEGKELVQKIKCPRSHMSGIEIEILREDNEQPQQIMLQVLNDYGVLFEKEYDTSKLSEKEGKTVRFRMKFPIVLEQSQDETLTFKWSVKNTKSDISVLMTDNGMNVVCNGYFSTYGCLRTLFFILAIAIVFIVTVIFYECYLGKWDADKVFLIAVLLWGLVYCGVLTIYSVPDEPSHIDTAYRISNRMLGVEDSGIPNALLKRGDDIEVNVKDKVNVSADSYKKMYDNLFSRCNNPKLTEIYARNNLSNVPEIFYYAPAIGISLGRAAGFGMLPTLLLGRLCSLMLAALMMYLGVRKLPFGKAVFYVIGLLPITLQEIMSFSYDSFLIGISYIFIGYLFSWLYGKQKFTVIETILFFSSTVLLSTAKGGAYLPLAGVVLLMPFQYQNNRKQKWYICAGLCMLVMLCYFVQYPTILTRIGVMEASAAGTNTETAMYSLSDLIGHPLQFFRLLENTFYEKADIYLSGMMGGRLGWLNIKLSWYLVAAFGVLLLMAVIPASHEHYIDKMGNRLWIWMLCAASMGLVFLSMLVSTTPAGESIVLGVQGRYFLPFLGLALSAIPSRNIVNRKKRVRNYIFAGSLLQIIVISQILIEVL